MECDTVGAQFAMEIHCHVCIERLDDVVRHLDELY